MFSRLSESIFYVQASLPPISTAHDNSEEGIGNYRKHGKAYVDCSFIYSVSTYKILLDFVNKHVPFPYISGWFEATQAFETMGFIAAIVALVLIVLYVFVPQTSGKKIVFILAMLACFAAGKV